MINSNWNKQSSPEKLSDKDIHVWLLDIFSITKSDEMFDDILSEDEIVKKNKYHFLNDRIVYSTSRGILRILLSKYLDVFGSSIQFKYNQYGKPSINKTSNLDIKFNLSHSKEFAVLVFTLDDEIGVDIEFINHELVIHEIADKYFSKAEVNELYKLTPEDQRTAFFNIWTRKEAYIKAKGKGLSIPLDSFDVSVNVDNPRILRSVNDEKLDNIYLNNLNIHSDYCGTILNIGNEKTLSLFLYLP